jgi:TolB-like protein
MLVSGTGLMPPKVIRRFLAVLLVPLYISVLPAAQQKRSVAVLNFQNSSGARSLEYLTTALPESISGALASAREIRTVERNSLKKVLKEIELGQTGAIDAAQVVEAGKLAHADILLLGSFSGDPEKITVTLKAVDVKTGVVMEGRSVTAPLADVLEQSSQAALQMASAIAGDKAGFLTITSNPDEAEVRIDGVIVGKTPLVEYKLSAGKHSLFLRKGGYKEEEREVNMQAGVVDKISETLLPLRKAVYIILGVGYQRLLPPSGPLQQANVFSGQIGFAISKWTFDLTYALNPSWEHSYNYSTPFGSLTDSRSYLVNAYLLGVTFSPFEFRYISPYVGLFGGFTRVTDYELTGSDKSSSKLASFDLFQVGGKFGLEIMPRQIFSLFIEGRYQYFPASISRPTKTSQGVLGGPAQAAGEIILSSFSVGGGIRLHF